LMKALSVDASQRDTAAQPLICRDTMNRLSA
jgi:hypothetical protein